MIHPHTKLQYINELIGQGVFATQPIAKGTIMWVRDALDRELTPDEVQQLDEPLRETMLTYCYRNAKGNYMLCWDHTKYTNHSFTPNSMITPYGFEIAIHDIAAGEQITNDYGTLNIIEPFTPCDEGTNRKTIHPNDLAIFHEVWDKQIHSAIKLFNTVSQPLKPYFSANDWQKIQVLSTLQQPPQSILECWYKSE
jgi:hypothetical protein